jgi:hypothetical protein
MRVDLLALYAGPDQVMTVTSGIASAIGILLVFWNKLAVAFFKLFKGAQPASPSPQQNQPTNPS